MKQYIQTEKIKLSDHLKIEKINNYNYLILNGRADKIFKYNKYFICPCFY